MFGFACDETPELMPMPIMYAHKLVERLAKVRKEEIEDFFGPDSKSQVTVRYEDNEPVAIDAVVVSTQHLESISTEQVREAVMESTIKQVIPAELLHAGTKYHINPTGRFVAGGPLAACGHAGGQRADVTAERRGLSREESESCAEILTSWRSRASDH